MELEPYPGEETRALGLLPLGVHWLRRSLEPLGALSFMGLMLQNALRGAYRLDSLPKAQISQDHFLQSAGWDSIRSPSRLKEE